MKILFAIMAVIFFFGMIGDKDKDERKRYTYAFITVVFGICFLYAIG